MPETNPYEEINITAIEGVRIGSAQDYDAKTGVTVVLFDNGATVGIDVSGGGPASRETHLADPTTADSPVNAIMLAGGSAFGLSAADGVMRYLEERGIGFDAGVAKVPLVCASCIFDLGIGSATVRPDADMGYAACVDAETNKPKSGNIGAGCGASVGKICGMDRCSESGLGIFAAQIGELKVGAIVSLNPFGDVYDPATGKQIAGAKSADGNGFVDTCAELYKTIESGGSFDAFAGNTTIGIVVTNAGLGKAQMSKVASMTRNAYARCIKPVGTMFDGDTIYATSVGSVEADINVVGTLACECMQRAILNAVTFS